MLWPAFIGGDAQSSSPNLDLETTENLYRETLSSQENAKKSVLFGTPGLRRIMTVSDQGCRGLYSLDDRTFAVVGQTLYELNLVTNTFVTRGIITNDGQPVSMVSNGRGGEQLLIVGGQQVKVLTLTTNVLSPALVLPLINAPVMADYLDTYFLLTEATSARIWYSGLANGLSWRAQDFFTRSRANDNVVGLKVITGRVHVWGSRTHEVFYNVGDVNTPFIPYPGTVQPHGATSPWAIGLLDETPVWLMQNTLGPTRIMRSTLQGVQTISTPEVSFAFGNYADLSRTELLTYEQEGHSFAVFTVPGTASSWAYDGREADWHQRRGWDAVQATSLRWRARGCCTVGRQVIVGDYANGNIYALDLDTFQDDGQILRRLRRAPYLSAENQWLFLDSLELGLQSGVGLPTGQGSAPTLQLRLSRDSGHTWTPTTINAGKLGEFNGRAVWQHLGRVRSDRLAIEISQTDPVRTVWGPGTWIRATPGTGLL